MSNTFRIEYIFRLKHGGAKDTSAVVLQIQFEQTSHNNVMCKASLCPSDLLGNSIDGLSSEWKVHV